MFNNKLILFLSFMNLKERSHLRDIDVKKHKKANSSLVFNQQISKNYESCY